MEIKIKDMNFTDVHKYGVDLKYVEHKIGDIECRLIRLLIEYFNRKFKGTRYSVNDCTVRGLMYNNIGGPQTCLVNLIVENSTHKYGSAFFKLHYTPAENNKIDVRYMKLNRLDWLNPKVPDDWDYIVNCKAETNRANYTDIY